VSHFTLTVADMSTLTCTEPRRYQAVASSAARSRWEMQDGQHRLASGIIERFEAAGECDFVREVGHVYPSTIFLQIIGMPLDKLPEFMGWEEKILRTLDDDDPDGMIRYAAMQSVTA
jgi:hypothetical protein